MRVATFIFTFLSLQTALPFPGATVYVGMHMCVYMCMISSISLENSDKTRSLGP